MFEHIRTSAIALSCLIRGLPLLFARRPRTPLRTLAIMALDTVHTLRHGRPMPRSRVFVLAQFLDFGACANADCDRKPLCQSEYAALRASLAAAGMGGHTADYLRELRRLENKRPPIGGNHRRFDAVRSYREEVVRTSLAAAGAVAMNERMDEVLRAIEYDGDMQALFRIALQCQVIDDVLDYEADVSAGLPSFLTATRSVWESAALTAGVARVYGISHGWSSHVTVWPLRAVLAVVTRITATAVWIGRWRYRRTLLLKSFA
jgi:hypothetical protein